MPNLSNTPTSDDSADPTADVVVERDAGGEYQVGILDKDIPQLHVSPRYDEMLRDPSTVREARQFVQRKIQAARWLIRAIERRRATIIKVVWAIIEQQFDFLDNGPEYIKPLKMQEIADRVGMHVTTVERAVDGKWIETPHGIFPLIHFASSSGGSLAAPKRQSVRLKRPPVDLSGWGCVPLEPLKIEPRRISFMEILQLPIVALEERIWQEMEDNPTLEQD